MKKRLYLFATTLCCIAAINVSAQVKPYLAIVCTSGETIKGVLYQVSADSICVKTERSTVSLCPTTIKTITIKEISKNSKYRKYFSNDPYNDRLLKVSRKMKPVRQWGEQGSTIEEELSCRIITGFYNAALNGIASSVKFIGGSSKYLDVHFNKLNYTKELNNLKTYSIVRQLTNQSVGMSTEQTLVQGD
jgi:hypothetical protein